jgi:hypothetical protein
MNNLLLLLALLNTFWLAYLTFIVYKKITAISHTKSDSTVQHSFKVGLSRFNPFQNMGGDQSFVLCLLDNTNSGAIITSLHNRDSTRVYAKQIKNGQGESQSLSDEEVKLLAKTVSN